MYKQTLIALRRGKPKPAGSVYPMKYRHVPYTHKPFQGGQQFFEEFNLKTADENAQVSNASEETSWKQAAHATFPQMDAAENRLTTEEKIQKEIAEMRRLDQWETNRSFSDRDWFEQQRILHQQQDIAASSQQLQASLQAKEEDGEALELEKDSTDEASLLSAQQNNSSLAQQEESIIPQTVDGADYFKAQFGYSMVKKTNLPVTMEYSQLDIWGERAKYTRDTYFIYIVSRRRNTYCVCFDFGGKKMHPVYSAGNKGLKGGDRGMRQEGGIEVAHQVASQYLNDLIPKLKLAASKTGNAPPAKFEVVLRLLGFYNGRQGAVRAVMDRSDIFNVKFVEDVTPFPYGTGPKMPKATNR